MQTRIFDALIISTHSLSLHEAQTRLDNFIKTEKFWQAWEMEEETKDMLVRWGKEDATDEDYVNIAIREGLLNTLKEADDE